MAKYIKQEMPDIAGKGEHQVYYRMQTERNIGAAEFVEEVTGLGTGLSEGAVTHVLEQMVQTRHWSRISACSAASSVARRAACTARPTRARSDWREHLLSWRSTRCCACLTT